MRAELAMTDELISRIYEAATLPELWPDVLGDVAEYGGAEDALFFSIVDGVQHMLGTPNIVSQADDWNGGGWALRSDRPDRIAKARHHGFITDLDVYTMDEIDNHPVYQEWLIPRGWGWGIGTSIPVPSGEQVFFTLERAWSRGPAGSLEVARMDALRPHLARSAVMSARLQQERARSATNVLELVGLPACVLNGAGRAIAMNPGCEALLPDTIRDGRVFGLVNATSQRLFEGARTSLHAVSDRTPRSIPITGTEQRPPMVVHLLPVERAARDLFGAFSAIVVFTALTIGHSPSNDVLAGLFDLTAAEARVASRVASLSTIPEIAAALGLTRETVRTQLRAVFSKTGTHRQTDLAALLTKSTLS